MDYGFGVPTRGPLSAPQTLATLVSLAIQTFDSEVIMEEQSQPPDEKSSLIDRGKGAVRRATKPLNAASDLITGRGLEQSVAEYSETLTQVALGIHEDVTALSRRVSELETDSRDKMAQTQRLKRAYLLGYSAITISLIALGVAVWSLL